MTEPTSAERMKRAVAAGTFRPRFDCPTAPFEDRAGAVTLAAWELILRRHPERPGMSQDETLAVKKVELLPGGGLRAEAVYWFDRDYCSQYDKSEEYLIGFDLAPDGAVSGERWE